MKNEDLDNLAAGITTLAGAKFNVFRYVSRKYGVENKFKVKWIKSALISLICTFFGLFDSIIYSLKTKPKELKDPIFIIGHWRSGTTLLHNLMCTDVEMGYTTTYQTVFPNNLFSFQWLFKWIMKLLMPAKRPVDNVPLHVDYPQEEEFAINNEIPFSFYNWWYFPKQTRAIADEYLFGKTTKPEDIKVWKKNFIRFINRSLLNTKGTRFISKNPPHTARIPELLAMFPNAKFIYIHRNPYEVVRSTFAFFKSILPTTQLQDINDENLMSDILWVYKNLILKYEQDKSNIPSQNLLEIKYADLVENPEKEIKHIYNNLLKSDYKKVENNVKAYVNSLNHKLKKYEYSQDFISLVNKHLSEIIKLKEYEVLG